MPMGGGQSGGGGGTVVSGPTPQAAMQAGQYMQEAAQAASAAATQATLEAVRAINKHYIQARADVQPYRTQGVQALNQLNQYIQLQPYNPGSAPVAPKKYTADDLMDQISKTQVRNAIRQNSTTYADSKGFQHASYAGPGYEELIAATPSYAENWKLDKTDGDPGGAYNIAGHTGQGYNTNAFLNNPIIQNAVRRELADELAREKNYNYDVDMEAYTRNQEEWAQNKAWYDQKMAEGPYTQQQITDKITALPGYQAELNQGIEAIGANAASKGYVGSGRILRELGMHGQNTLSTFYNNELARLADLAGMGAQAAGASAQNAMSVGANTASLQQSLGDTKANSILAGGNAMAQAILAANQEHKIIGGNSGGGGGGLGGIGSILGGIGSIMSAMPSSRKLKTKVKKARSKSMLAKLAKLDVDYWTYNKGVHDEATHIGPYAEDFQAAFGVGDGKSIDVISYLGVLTGSIKELAKQAVKAEKKGKSNAR